MMEKYGCDKNLAFGGLTLILTGDLAQVPAVLRFMCTDINEAKNMFTSMDNANTFHFSTLDIIQKQKNADEDFLYLLDEVREHRDDRKLSEKSLKLLKSVFIKGGMTKEIINCVVDFIEIDGLAVFYTNDMLDIYNEQLLIKFYSDIIKTFDGLFLKKLQFSYMQGNDKNQFRKYEYASDRDVSFMKYYLKKNSNLVPIHLKVSIGCKVMHLRNIDCSKGFVNGRTGIISDIKD